MPFLVQLQYKMLLEKLFKNLSVIPCWDQLLFSGVNVVMFKTMSLSGSGSVDMWSLGRQLRSCLPLIIVPSGVAKAWMSDLYFLSQ